MKKLYILVGLIIAYCLLAVAMNNRISNQKLEGKWNVKVANAPYGYQDYVFDIKEDKGEYKADVLFVDSKNRLSNQALTLKDGKLTGSVYVEDEKIEITVWEEKGVVQGTAKSPSIGTMAMTFTRPKE